MFYRSLGAGTFAGFWRYWNPVFGYYLGRYIYAPLKSWLPSAAGLVTTFVVCGAFHDAIGSAVTGRMMFLFTPWFFFMGTGVVLGRAVRFDYSHLVWPVRAVINVSYVGVCLLLAYAIKA